MPERYDIRLIEDAAALRELCARLVDLPRLGLDTEFHAEHRYWPDLMLVQLAEPGGPVWIIDPRRIVDLTPLGRVLERVEIVVHGGQQDVALMRRATGAVPTRLLDTQRCAGLLGLGYPTRLPLIARALLGREIQKAVGLSDWTVRPLTQRQRVYAAEDAVLTLELVEALEARLRARGRWAWAIESSALTIDEALSEPDESRAWLSWDIASSLEEVERSALQALVDWREEVGRANNQPARAVLSDGLALDLARRRPNTLDELAENRRLPASLVKRHGRVMLEVIQHALASGAPAPTPAPADLVLRAQVLELWASLVERDHEVARALLLPRSLAIQVAREGGSALRGWRAELARAAGLDALLAGRDKIAILADRVDVVGP